MHVCVYIERDYCVVGEKKKKNSTKSYKALFFSLCNVQHDLHNKWIFVKHFTWNKIITASSICTF